jgi:hypothetical protein
MVIPCALTAIDHWSPEVKVCAISLVTNSSVWIIDFIIFSSYLGVYPVYSLCTYVAPFAFNEILITCKKKYL